MTRPSHISDSLPAAVLWDMDGTIIDSEPYWMDAEFNLVAEHGGEWNDEKAHHLVGKNLWYSAEFLRSQGNVAMPAAEIIDHLQSIVIERMGELTPWRPGALGLISRFADLGVPQALVTMSWSPLANALVDILPPDTFSTVVSGDRVTNGKPHPEPYLLALAELGLSERRADVVAIEDSPTGIASAVASGVQVIAIPHIVEIVPGPYRIVNSLTDLTPDLMLAPVSVEN